jgi:hypothetical protein
MADDDQTGMAERRPVLYAERLGTPPLTTGKILKMQIVDLHGCKEKMSRGNQEVSNIGA